MNKILITGGAGFIGSHTADLLLKKGYKVRILDHLSPASIDISSGDVGLILPN